MPTKEEIEVFNQMQECIQINEVEQVSPSGIIFEYNGITYCIKCESSQSESEGCCATQRFLCYIHKGEGEG